MILELFNTLEHKISREKKSTLLLTQRIELIGTLLDLRSARAYLLQERLQTIIDHISHLQVHPGTSV